MRADGTGLKSWEGRREGAEKVEGQRQGQGKGKRLALYTDI